MPVNVEGGAPKLPIGGYRPKGVTVEPNIKKKYRFHQHI